LIYTLFSSLKRVILIPWPYPWYPCSIYRTRKKTSSMSDLCITFSPVWTNVRKTH